MTAHHHHPEQEEQEEQPKRFASNLNTILMLLSLVTFVGTSLGLTWHAGSIKAELFKEVQDLHQAVDNIQQAGSTALQLHKSKQDETDREFNVRLDKLERTIDLMQTLQLTLANFNGRLDTLDAKVDAVKQALDVHNKTTQQMLRGIGP